VINASLLHSGDPSAGITFELNAIAAVVVGGTSFTGGVGTLTGTALGALVIGVLGNGLNLLGLHFTVQHMVKGLVILLAVSLDVLRRRREA
jgi:ribose transport system permease protein